MIWLVIFLALTVASDGFAESPRQAALDSLEAVEARLKKGGLAGDYAALGEAYARAGDLGRATNAYEKAVELDEKDLQARYALGHVYFRRAVGKGLKAIQFRRKAMLTARRMQEIDPSYPPTYFLLGLCYEWLENDSEQALKYYERYVSMRPDDPEGLLGIGRACLDLKQFKKIEQELIPYCERHPEDARLMPVLAQVDLLHGRAERALDRFNRYLEALDPAERALYEDVRPVASTPEAEAFGALAPADRPAFLRRFWARRDADILTEVSEGQVEHYRRVWYARTYFGRIVHPWDRRGEVYIRYGEPDSRSRAGHMDVIQSEAVQRVKERMAQTLYGTVSQDVSYAGPVFPVKSRYSGDVTLAAPLDKVITNPGSIVPRVEDAESPSTDNVDLRGSTNAALPTQLPTGASVVYAPVTTGGDHSLVLWESWIYANIGGGIEVTFTDELNNGVYDYAPIPTVDFKEERAIARLSKLAAYAPKAVVDRAASETPAVYQVKREGEALRFYYDTADYRGADGKTRVEIAYGFPTKEMGVLGEGDTLTVAVERAVALATKDRSEVFRIHDGTALKGKGIFLKQRGEFIPALVRLEAPPGDYELAVQIVDRVSGRTGLYKQDLRVKSYAGEGLLISDVALAFAVLDQPAGEQFRKGDVWVLPMPTRAYGAGQPAAAYYEVYNLQRDASGHTRYRVEYSIRSDVDEAGEDPISRAIVGVKKFIRGRKPQVSVAYDRAGSASWDAGYLTLDLKKVKPGRNLLRVSVTDLIGGQSAEREVAFRYGK